MPLYQFTDNKGYEYLIDNNTGNKVYTHKIIDNLTYNNIQSAALNKAEFLDNTVSKAIFNHKVESVEVIDLDEYEDVFDLTIDDGMGSHNFALEVGVVVHNCDLADTGEAGISMCHKELSTDGQIKYVFDFVGRIISPNRISLEMINDFIIDLRNEAEVTFAVLSADQYQSVAMLQKMEVRNMAKKVKRLSVDMTCEAYNTAANAVHEGSVVTGTCRRLKQQLGKVYIEKNKPFAENDDRKDMADSFVGSLYNAITYAIDMPINIYEHYQYISEIQDGDVPEGFIELK